MSKNIVVITGSPRKNGNSFAMTDSFIRAAEAKGHTVTRFDAAMMKIGGCHACETCFKTGKACSFDDDFNIIAPAVLAADVIVFTMPVYWYSIPAQIKGVIDRLYSLVVGGKDITGKECALIACCEERDLSVLDGVRIPMERTAALNKWKMVGEVLIPGVLNAGVLRLSDLYEAVPGDSRPSLECETLTLNINYGHNRALMEKCRRLEEYAIFVHTVRENLEKQMTLDQAVTEAVDTCIRSGVLKDILTEQKSEVIQMVLETFDQEKYEKAMHQEGYDDGYSDGKADLFLELIRKKLVKGISLEEIARELETDLETVQKLTDQI